MGQNTYSHKKMSKDYLKIQNEKKNQQNDVGIPQSNTFPPQIRNLNNILLE
jgi:hypothetical protein